MASQPSPPTGQARARSAAAAMRAAARGSAGPGRAAASRSRSSWSRNGATASASTCSRADERVERLEAHLGVARPGEQPARVAKRRCSRAGRAPCRCDVRSRRSTARSFLRSLRASCTASGVVAAAVVELIAGVAEAPDGDPAQALSRGLAAPQPVGAPAEFRCGRPLSRDGPGAQTAMGRARAARGRRASRGRPPRGGPRPGRPARLRARRPPPTAPIAIQSFPGLAKRGRVYPRVRASAPTPLRPRWRPFAGSLSRSRMIPSRSPPFPI